MAANFTVTPTVVEHDLRDHNIIETQAEDMKKEYYKLSNTPTVRYRLVFNAISTTVMNSILDHYSSCYGGYDNFTWTSVPSYIESGSNLTGRWVEKSLSIAPARMARWNVEILFEKDV